VNNTRVFQAHAGKVKYFQTLSAPESGVATVTPAEGNFLSTYFQIGLSQNWTTEHPPITYRVLGVQRSGTEVSLHSEWLQSTSTLNITLPDLQSLVVEVTDEGGEIVRVPLEVNITLTSEVNVTTIVEEINNAES